MSTPHCSFVIYLFRDVDSLRFFIQDFRAFFQKFPLQYELICVMEGRSHEEFLDRLQHQAPANESWQILYNSKFQGRAQSLQKALDHARAEIIVFPSITMSTPLGDLFKLLQNLITEPALDACWGERYSKKSAMFTESSAPALKLEHTFNTIFKEKHPRLAADSLCEIGVLRKNAWTNIRELSEIKKKKGWFLLPAIKQALADRNHLQIFLPVHDSGIRPKDFSIWKMRWELLRQSLFETL